MADKDILQSVYPHIGGQENISRTIPRKNILYVMLKDAGAVDLDSVRQTEGIEAAELERGRLALHLAGQEEKENTMAQDYQKMGEAILEAVGGKENITALTHCATRLRFNLADDSKADEAKVKAVKGVMGVRNQGGQFQVIIGQDVSFPYDVIMKICKLDANKNDASAANDGKKKKPLDVVMDTLAGIFTPVLPAVIGGGMVTVVYTLLTLSGLVSAESDLGVFLNFLGNAPMYFMPIMVAYTAAQKFGSNPFLAMALAAAMMHPTFQSIVASGESFHILGLPVMLVTYSNNTLPIILSVWAMSYFDKFFNKHISKVVRIFVAPLLTLLCGSVLAFVVIGPLGTIVANGLTVVFSAMIDHAGWLVTAIWGAFSPILVMTGMHYTLGSLFSTMYYMVGYEGAMMPGMLVSNVAQGAAALAVRFASKDEDTKALALSAGVTGLMGITEPALYGVNLRYKKPLYAAMIGGGVGGLICGLFGVKAYVMASPGLISLPIFIGGDSMTGFIWACIGAAVSIVVAFVASYVMMKAEFKKNPENA